MHKFVGSHGTVAELAAWVHCLLLHFGLDKSFCFGPHLLHGFAFLRNCFLRVIIVLIFYALSLAFILDVAEKLVSGKILDLLLTKFGFLFLFVVLHEMGC